MPKSSSRSRAVSLATFCELWGRKSSGSIRAGSTTSMCERMTCKRALEDLGLAPDVEVVAGLEGPGQPFAGVPEPGADAAGLVPELQVEVEVALAIGPELLVGDQEDLVDGVAVGQLIDVATAHAASSIGCGSAERASRRARPGHEARL